MNLNNVKQKLDKVNRFFSYLEANQDIISRVDHETFLSSIRSLYDSCFDDNATEEVPVTKVVEKIVEQPIVDNSAQQKTKVQEKPEPKKRPKLVFNTSPAVKKEIETPPVKKEEPVVITTPKEEPVVEQKQHTAVEKQVEKPAVTTPIIKKEEPAAKSVELTKQDSFNEDFEDLFLFKEATELSQKLSEAPIPDLNKALGLNEKFLYINELFGGDVAKFQSSIKTLNDGGSFDKGRSYMENELVEQHGWMKTTKKTIAKDFVKLVRRRYL